MRRLTANTCLVLLLCNVSYGFVQLNSPNLLPKATRHSLPTRCVTRGLPQQHGVRGLQCKFGAEDKRKNAYLSGKQFDLLSLRSFRREAIVQYENANQAEPIRIILSFLFTAFSLSFPALVEALGGDKLDGGGLAACAVATAVSGGLFLRERQSRTRRLTRMDREAAAAELSITYVDSMSGARRTFPLRELRGKRNIVALYGPPSDLKAALLSASIYRRRLALSQVSIVAVTSAGSSQTDLLSGGFDDVYSTGQRLGWLWQPTNEQMWRNYFTELLELRQTGDGTATGGSEGAWLALNTRGRSCGSGRGAPTWDELLGSVLPPTDFSPEADDPALSDKDKGVLEAHSRFYGALTSGDVEGMRRMWSSKVQETGGFAELLKGGGKLDTWEDQLKEGARPDGLSITSRDVTMVSDTEAWTTCIETGKEQIGQLLATQHWIRDNETEDWQLFEHRTLPYSPGVTAAATLRCDCRGCVAGLRQRK